MKYSIVVPTYNHCNDLLKPCVESVFKYTDMDNAELIVVANGCTDNTKEYLDNLGKSVKVVWNTEPLGYTMATNMGIRQSIGQYVILLNNDTLLLDFQEKNGWLQLLEQPFINDETVGMTGPLELYDHDVRSTFLVFCLVMIKQQLFEQFGLLDEIFSPGYGEDIDFNMKLKRNGYKCIEVCRHTDDINKKTYSTFPFWHKSTQTFGAIPSYHNEIVPRNQQLLRKRYSS